MSFLSICQSHAIEITLHFAPLFACLIRSFPIFCVGVFLACSGPPLRPRGVCLHSRSSCLRCGGCGRCGLGSLRPFLCCHIGLRVLSVGHAWRSAPHSCMAMMIEMMTGGSGKTLERGREENCEFFAVFVLCSPFDDFLLSVFCLVFWCRMHHRPPLLRCPHRLLHLPRRLPPLVLMMMLHQSIIEMVKSFATWLLIMFDSFVSSIVPLHGKNRYD